MDPMTVILVDPRRPTLVPVEAIELLGGDVQYTEEIPVRVPWSLPAARPVHTGQPAPVLLSSDAGHPEVAARIAAGEQLISAPDPAHGERILDAVAVMDRLRSSGPWEGEQTHDSLRRYLLEETYELFDAVRSGDPESVRDELGDVLLQVLFHARIAEDALEFPFSIDDVADALVRKLNNRVPAVLAGESVTLEQQITQWDERKALEKCSRESAMDDLPTAQPALALAQKVLDRARRAGIPGDLVPDGMRTITLSEGVDAETHLRAAVLEFMDDVRAAEQTLTAMRVEAVDGPAESIGDEQWRAAWPLHAQPNSVEPQ
jgi:XTP/dITP diphosphohydrolase